MWCLSPSLTTTASLLVILLLSNTATACVYRNLLNYDEVMCKNVSLPSCNLETCANDAVFEAIVTVMGASDGLDLSDCQLWGSIPNTLAALQPVLAATDSCCIGAYE